MRAFRWIAATLLATCTSGAFADCGAAPWQDRVLYLRGSFNGWRAEDETAFRWACDHYELVAALKGEQAFKVGDEDWTLDTDLGAASDTAAPLAAGTPAPLARKGPALRATFTGMARVTLQPATRGGAASSIPSGGAASPTPRGDGAAAPTLRIDPLPADTPLPPPPPSTLDAVARSLQFDSRAPASKSPFGAVVAGTPIRFTVTALPGVESITLVVERRRLEGNETLLAYDPLARVPLVREAGARERWSATYTFTSAAIHGYWFEARVAGRTILLENNANALYWTRERGTGGPGVAAGMPSSPQRIRRFRQTVYLPGYHVPAWAADAVYYYIFPERYRNGDKRNDPKPGVDKYQDHDVELHTHWTDRPWRPGTGDGSDDVYNNDFFGGDIAGIIEKLDDIAALGANTLYITPMFTAASNHKYDTADYRHIDPHFGTDDDFTRLCREAARRGLRVLPDTSLNHTGTDSIYFDRYGHYTAGGNVGAFAGGHVHRESPWATWYHFDPSQPTPERQYTGWVGVADLPEIDKTSPSFRDFAYRAPDSVMKRWLDRGAAGWRMDVAPWVPDDFWREWRSEIRRHRPEALTVAETWFDASKFLVGDMFDSTMNYIFRNALIDYANGGSARKMTDNLEHLREAYPPQAFHAMMNLLSTHDAPRSLHLFGDVDGQATPAQVTLAKRRLLLAMFFQMTYPGSPAIYYGDEVGVTGGEDPMNRATYPWPDQGGHPDLALKAEVAALVKLRHDLPVLRHGTLLAPLHVDEHVVVLARQDGSRWALTATNNGDEARSVTVALPAGAPVTGWRDPRSGRPVTVDHGRLTLAVPALGGAIAVGGVR